MSDPKYLPKGRQIINAKSIENYEKRLKERIDQIKDAVDSHMEVLLKATKKRD